MDHVEVKTTHTTSSRFNHCKYLSRDGIITISLLRDLTASGISTRGRSFHTSLRVERLSQAAKGNNLSQKDQVTKVFELAKDDPMTSPIAKRTDRRSSLDTLVQKDLQQCIDRRGNYNGLINILKKPEFLVACYESIKGKSGIMAHGSNYETLDGISWNWFTKVSEQLSLGKFEFTPSRRVVIPKPQGGTRPLGINSPREKIVQKALAVILEHI